MTFNLPTEEFAELIILLQCPDKREPSYALKSFQVACVHALNARIQANGEGEVLEVPYSVRDSDWELLAYLKQPLSQHTFP